MKHIKQFRQPIDSALYRYHQSTKHTIDSLLNNNYSLDWNNQPNPFRHYQDAENILLPRNIRRSEISYFDLLKHLSTLSGIKYGAEAIKNESVKLKAVDADLSFLSELLFFSMSISAWKQVVGTDHRWALRVNPSSGNLHPTEVHIAIQFFTDLAPGIYHYNVPDHSLEQRCSNNPFNVLPVDTNSAPIIICLTSIFWREAWKYRTRAFRYCQHDLGHALCAISLSAALLGWRAEVIGEFCDSESEHCLGLVDSDEKPMLFIALHPSSINRIEPKYSLQISMKSIDLKFTGIPNVLSKDIITYKEIKNIYQSTRIESLPLLAERQKQNAEISKNEQSPLSSLFNDKEFFSNTTVLPLPDWQESLKRQPTKTRETLLLAEPAQSLIRRRRSCLSLDSKQRMPLPHLSTILWNATQGFTADFSQSDSFINLFIYLHRIDGVDPGLYLYDRKNQSLIQLTQSDVRNAAKFVSCFQDIAADGCFAVSMVADLLRAYELFGDRGYRYVHYQSGNIGQLLYLSSLALDYESTGIGCFADDEVNKMLKLAPGFEVIYNFTIGRAVTDSRLTDLPAYKFLEKIPA